MVEKTKYVKKITTIIKKNPKIALISIISIVILIVSGFTTYQYTVVEKWSNLIYPGIKIQGQDISGKTKEQAKKIMSQRYSSIISKRKLNIEIGEKKYSLDYDKINPKYNVDQIIDEVYSYGKNHNFVRKYYLIAWPSTKDFKLKFIYDTKVVDEFINNVEKDINKDPVNATLKIDGENITVVPEQKGTQVKKDKLKAEVKNKLTNEIRGDINIKPPIQSVNAKITADKIKSINSKISSFSTNYSSISSGERSNNIQIATNSINGTILLPGDTFSFNDIVGERTAEKGYMAAPVIIGNKVESGLGGGVCQVSSTLYNAILKSNIKPTEREHHTLRSHYVPLGLDATVDYGNIDYKFKNTLSYPIYIEADASDGDVSFNIYSNSELRNCVTEIDSNVYATIEANVRYIDDPEMAEGTTEVEKAPSTGYKVRAIKRTTQGEKTTEEVLTDDFYRPVEGVIKRGVKKPIEVKEKIPVNDSTTNTPPPAPTPVTPTPPTNPVDTSNESK